MKEILATVTGRGQVTVPAEVRRLLQTRKGDKLAFLIDEEGQQVTLARPSYPDIASLRGAAGTLFKSLPWERIRDTGREDSVEARYEKKR